MKTFKIIFKVTLAILLCFTFVIGIYIIYMQINYYRIKDNTELKIENNQTTIVDKTNTYSITTYNIGFGAYSPDFSFFMDEGKMLDGTKVSGNESRAFSKKDVLNNMDGIIKDLNTLDSDFILLQEVDKPSSRSYKVNEVNMITESFNAYSYNYASNFHSSYLMYPITKPHGKVSSGILSLSKYQMTMAIRKKLPISTSFFTKFFDLDRCLAITRYKVDDKELVIINVHLSAYDEGGYYRKQQLELLNEILKEENDRGNYVIAGGDFNHDIANSINYFETKQYVSPWVSVLKEEDIVEGFSLVSSLNAPTCRSTDMKYVKNINYTVVVDGFIVSNNIDVKKVINIDLDFKNSDHNPVNMQFSFKE